MPFAHYIDSNATSMFGISNRTSINFQLQIS
uniref:Uncharacterized protein n=1 Tax=Rhizophora mucronata TaxID=61149 RepID=A0A2P2NHA9_RHIMU